MNEDDLAKILRANPDVSLDTAHSSAAFSQSRSHEESGPVQPVKRRVLREIDESMLVPEKHATKRRQMFRSKTERAALAWLISERPDYEILYEAVSFNLPGGRYTPDFTVFGLDEVIHVEVKSSAWKKAYASSRGSARAMKEYAAKYSNIFGSLILLVKHDNGFEQLTV